MANLQLLTCLALAIVFTQSTAQYLLPQIYPLPKGYIKEPLTLTCAVNFTDKYKPSAGIVNAIAVTIKEKGGLYGNMFPYLGGGGSSQGSGLSASINVFSLIGGPVSIAFTERARPERGCYAEDFGSFFTGLPTTPAYGGYGQGPSFGGIGGGYGGGIGGIGGLGGYGSGYGQGYGQGYGNQYGMGGQGGGFGMGGPGQGMGMGGPGPMGGQGPMGGLGPMGGARYPGVIFTDRAPGIIANIRLTPGTASEINIDTLSGFSNLKELAGRGIIVCPDAAVENKYGDSVCESGILSCCALHYDNGEQRLSVSYGY